MIGEKHYVIIIHRADFIILQQIGKGSDNGAF